MTFKEFIISRVRLFFFLTTMILAATAVLGGFLAPEQQLMYYNLYSPIIIAALCVLPTCVTYFKKEPTVRQYIIRDLLELALIEAVVLFLVSPPKQYSGSKVVFYIILGTAVMVIYLIAMLMMWLQKKLESEKLTEQLRQLQENN